MNEIIVVCVLFMLMLGGMALYFHGRVMYAEKKIGLLESIILDIKMTLEMEQEARQFHEMPHKVTLESLPVEAQEELRKQAAAAAAPLQAEEQAQHDEAAFYSSVIDSAVSQEPDAAEATASDAVPSINYEAMTRDEVAAIAEKRGLRVTKRMGKPSIIGLLREADKKPSSVSESGNEVGTAAAAPGGVDPSSGGAPLDMGVVAEEVSLDD
jgi:hypothetical protein